MKHIFLRVASILPPSMLIGVLVAASAPTVQAETVMRFTAPFISNAGIIDSAGDRHFFTVNVTGFPLESLLITLPDSMKLDEAMVTSLSGQDIKTSQTLQDGVLFLQFAEAIQPENSIRVRLTGAETETPGNRLLYRIAAVKSGIDTPLPLGTAMIRLPDVDL